MLDAIHADQIQQHGGSHGVNSEALIEPALARLQNLLADVPASDLAALAASLGYGLAKNHGFSDGNKRTAFMAIFTFLGLNGFRLTAPEPEVVQLMLSVATDELGEEALAGWIRNDLTPFDH